MEESATYQWIIQKGKAEEARQIVTRLGTQKFGAPPTPAQAAALAAIADRDQLERTADRIFVATGWDDLLATP